jgi:hypothetical protein
MQGEWQLGFFRVRPPASTLITLTARDYPAIRVRVNQAPRTETDTNWLMSPRRNCPSLAPGDDERQPRRGRWPFSSSEGLASHEAWASTGAGVAVEPLKRLDPTVNRCLGREHMARLPRFH